MSLSDISLKRPVFATVIIIALIALGVVSYTGLSLNTLPEVDPTYVTATVILPSASPDQVESKVSKKVEGTVGQISGVKHLNTIISEGVSTTVIEFELEKSSEVALQEVKDKVSSIRNDLPTDILEPIISKYDMTAMPIMSLVVTGPLENRELSRLADDVIKKRLATVSEVGAINIYGNQEREIQIKLDKEKMAAYNLTTSEVVNSFKTDNLDVPSGKITNGNNKMTIRTNGAINKVSDFYNIRVANRNGVEIRVKDIAEVIDDVKEMESLSFFKGKDAISMDVIKQSGGDTVKIVEAIKVEITNIQSSLPAGVKIEIASDNSIAIHNTVNGVLRTLLEGCILAVIIVFIFLGEWRITAISAISLPTSIITTFTLLKIMNYSLNMLTLIGLSLAVGLLIDDAIVVLENIVRHMHAGKSPMQAAKEGTSEISLAVMATTFAVVAVFLPIAMVKGMIGRFFAQFGLTVVFSLLVSLFVSFTLIPVMTAKFVKNEEKAKKSIIGDFLTWFNKCFDTLTNAYTKLLRSVLHHRAITLLLVMIIFIGSLGLFPLLKTSTMVQQDLGELTITADMDSGTILEMAGKKAKEMEKLIEKHPEVRYVYTTVKPDKINLFVKITDKNDREESSKAIAAEMRKKLQKVPGINFAVNQNGGFSAVEKEVSYHIQGSDFTQVQEFAIRVKQVMNSIPGTADVGISYKEGNPEIKLDVDRDKAADLGVSTGAVASTLDTLFNSVVVSQFDSGTDRHDVRLSIRDDQRQNLDSFDGIYVAGTKGLIPLGQVTKKVFSTSSAKINRYDKEREIQISANLDGISQGDFDKTFMSKLKNELGIPKDISVSIGGTAEMTGGGLIGLIVALLMGILFIFLILAAQFESFADPLAILFSLPLAIIGAIWALYVSDSEVSMTSMIGFIMLMGLVTKNAILLVDFAKQKRSNGDNREDALLQAGNIRIRPIMMTSLAMIFGMIPTALGTEAGSEITGPMGIVIIGGLISSTLLTLLVVPIIYTIIDDVKGLFSKNTETVVKEVV